MLDGDQGGFARTGGSSMHGSNQFSPPHMPQPQSIEKNHQLKNANIEIMELREKLNYAEFALAKTMREKESVEASKR
jgi:hypothetical protein